MTNIRDPNYDIRDMLRRLDARDAQAAADKIERTKKLAATPVMTAVATAAATTTPAISTMQWETYKRAVISEIPEGLTIVRAGEKLAINYTHVALRCSKQHIHKYTNSTVAEAECLTCGVGNVKSRQIREIIEDITGLPFTLVGDGDFTISRRGQDCKYSCPVLKLMLVHGPFNAETAEDSHVITVPLSVTQRTRQNLMILLSRIYDIRYGNMYKTRFRADLTDDVCDPEPRIVPHDVRRTKKLEKSRSLT